MLEVLLSAAGIFSLRIVDVSMGTLRIAMLVRGRRALAGIFGFFESLVWLIAAALVFGNLESPIQFVAYAGGYAAGTMFGSTLEKWMAIGDAMIRIVWPVGTADIDIMLREEGFFVTSVRAEGRDGEVKISLSVLPRKRINHVVALIQKCNSQAFVTFDETTPIPLAVAPAARVRK